jgi:preprotein translocase subunit SecB
MQSGIESAFQFISYKIDTLSMEVTKDVRSLLFNGILGPEQVQLALSLRNPLHIKVDNAYVGGIEIMFSMYFSNNLVDSNRIAFGKAGISGFFKVAGDLSEEAEKNLVRLQIPAILFPYIRSAITALTINAGFPGVVVPLINVQEWARQAGDNIKIQEIGEPSPTSPASTSPERSSP